MNANANNFDPPESYYNPEGTYHHPENNNNDDLGEYQGEYYNHDGNNTGCQDYSCGYYDQYGNAPSVDQWNEAGNVENGYFSQLPQFFPQLYSAPISSIAHDVGYSSMYVASHTLPFGDRGRRASMLVTHSTIDGSLYSSCGGHPEADAGVLQSMYKIFFCGDYQIGRRNYRLPAHAFIPPFGGATIQQHAQLGISALMPVVTGYVTSVSPAGVRVHTAGGLCVSDYEVSGMICGTSHPESKATHVSVGGYNSQISCLDLCQNLRVVSSYAFQTDKRLGVMSLCSNAHKKALVAGCSDGTLRLVDGRMRGAELARIKSHSGGVTDVASSEDGTLVATTGFASKSATRPATVGLYAYPDPHLLIYDVRYLGRGGIVHPFSGMKGSPRMISFLPDMDNHPRNRLLVASGQAGGGMQIMTAFEEPDKNPLNFIFPPLDQGEAMTCMSLSNDSLAIGTSQSTILQFKLAGYDKGPKTIASDTFRGVKNPSLQIQTGISGVSLSDSMETEKISLEVPNFYPGLPPFSISPTVLFKDQPAGNTTTDSLFSSYIMCTDPLISSKEPQRESIFDPIARDPLVPTSRRIVASTVINAGSKSRGDSGLIVPASALKIELLSKDDTNVEVPQSSKGQFSNPNKLLYSEKLASTCFSPDMRRNGTDNRRRSSTQNSTLALKYRKKLSEEASESVIPARYRLTLRPQNIVSPHFEYRSYNKTGIFPGWDYPPSMPSAHVPSVSVLLYFVPEIRAYMLEHQFDKRLHLSKTVDQVPTLSTELGFLFHNIDSISNHAMSYPGKDIEPHVGVFTPSLLLTAFKVMPEAINLALLDDNPAVAIKARRPEAFYRFLLHHIDKEAGTSKDKPLDLLHGINFVCINEFISSEGQGTVNTVRALTLDLSYDPFLNNKSKNKKCKWRFCEILGHNLCKEARLRAWCKTSKTFETVVQRKVATSLPKILSLSCSCAGSNEEDGLAVWRTSFNDFSLWLPDFVEIELGNDGKITVREQIDTNENGKKWVTFESSDFVPSISKIVNDHRVSKKTKVRYRLESVLSFVKSDSLHTSSNASSENETKGHHVLHVRIPQEYRNRSVKAQLDHAKQLYRQSKDCSDGDKGDRKLVLTSMTEKSVFKDRIKNLEEKSESKKTDEWILFNGFVVSPTSVEDARAFHVTFKEPCLVMYREMDESLQLSENHMKKEPAQDGLATGKVMFSKSLSNNLPSRYAPKGESDLPCAGDIVALDAEFVSVQEEEAISGDNGNKIILRETRHALARVSVIDCRTGSILIDDYIVPREPVVDYLTRFSGIVPGDLDAKSSPHHLVTARTAYLKLRFLMERGCIFLGHGLSQDFLTVNLYVPPSQIIDTVEIYHKERMRYISLRFLTNYVLERDMQQDVHDSVEDAKAAWELYKQATKLIEQQSFNHYLDQLYEYGAKVEWSLGV